MTERKALGGDRSRREDLAMVGGLLLLGVALPLVIGAIAGSLDIPRNDDWSYRRIALELARTGNFVLDGISETMIIGQIIITQPFLWVSGLEPWAFTVAGVLFAAAGILGAYALARSLLSARQAALAAALLAIFPGYLAYATSYMSDVPALAAQFLCVAMGAVALRRRPVRVGWLVASAMMGIFAFSIREFAIAAPASVMLAVLCTAPRRARYWALAIGIAACCAGIHLWRTSLPGQLGPVGPGYGSIDDSILALTSVAFVVAPAALVGAIRWRPHLLRLDVAMGLGLGLVLVLIRLLEWLQQGRMPLIILDNLMSQWGAPTTGYLIGGRPLLFSDAAWILINLMALAAAVAAVGVGIGIIGAYVRRWDRSVRTLVDGFGSPLGSVVLFCLAVSCGLVFFGLSRPLFDRYFWPLVPPLAVLFLYMPRDLSSRTVSDAQSTRLLAGGAAVIGVLLTVTSLTYLLNSVAFDSARWRAGEWLVRAGIHPDEIDAGYEWVGYHATSQGDPTQRTSTETFYRSWWPSFRQCGLVSSETLSPTDAELLGTMTYERKLILGPTETLYLYRARSSDCAPD